MLRTTFLLLYWTVIILLFGPLLILYGVLGGSQKTYYRWGTSWVLFPLRHMGINMRVEGRENIPEGACVFAANHVSFIDPPLLLSAIVPKRVGILMKKSLFIPIVGTAFRIAHFIPIDRSRRSEAMASIREAAENMKTLGIGYMIYPEGTRSPDGRLLPFKRAGFAMAIEARAPVVPVCVVGPQRILPHNSFRIHGGEVLMKFCPPIDGGAYTMEQRGELAEAVHAALAAALPEDQRPLDTPTAPGPPAPSGMPPLSPGGAKS